MPTTIERIATELAVREQQVQAAVDLLDSGATVPFIARYRKEATGGLDDIALRALETRLAYLRELDDRRLAILRAVEEQGKLTDATRLAFLQASTKQELEDLYLPFKLKRRTKGEMAREAGLEPLADLLLAEPSLVPPDAATTYVLEHVEAAPDGEKRPDYSTVALVLDENLRNGIIKPGNLVLTMGFGGGLTWGGLLVRF